MKRTSLLQRHLFITLLGTIALVLGGFALSFWYVQSRERERSFGPLPMFASLIERLSVKYSVPEAFKMVVGNSRDDYPGVLALLDENGQLIAGNRNYDPERLPLPSIEELPAEPGEFMRYDTHRDRAERPSVVRLDFDPPRYLISAPGGPGRRGGMDRRMMSTNFIFVTVSALLSALLSFAVLVYYLRKNAGVIESVISRIHDGDLKARFPVKKLDEVGTMMTKFNEMADEIEELVERVRESGAVKVNILRELGHDFRTPLASLKNMIETLESKAGTLQPAQIQDLASISNHEVNYLTRLVDDLLFLARVDDPRYLKQGSSVDARVALFDEIERLEVSGLFPGKKITFVGNQEGEATLFGDPHLLSRLFRNTLENALSFARSQVQISLLPEADAWRILVEDDGPGFGPEMLDGFGSKRTGRSMREGSSSRISSGLGSVIMKAVTQAHQGELVVSNTSVLGGAKVEIRLPSRSKVMSTGL